MYIILYFKMFDSTVLGLYFCIFIIHDIVIILFFFCALEFLYFDEYILSKVIYYIQGVCPCIFWVLHPWPYLCIELQEYYWKLPHAY